MPINSDYFSIEPLMIQRLKDAAIPGVRAVYSSAEIARVEENMQITPALHVLFHGDNVLEGKGNQAEKGKKQKIEQNWMIVVAVNHAAQINPAAEMNQQAGEIISQVLTQLSGWRPSFDHGELYRVNGPGPDRRAGFAYFPLVFKSAVVTG